MFYLEDLSVKGHARPNPLSSFFLLRYCYGETFFCERAQPNARFLCTPTPEFLLPQRTQAAPSPPLGSLHFGGSSRSSSSETVHRVGLQRRHRQLAQCELRHYRGGLCSWLLR